MRKVICAPEHLIPTQLDDNTEYFSMYSKSSRKNVGSIGNTLILKIEQKYLQLSEVVWDFISIALAIVAADRIMVREDSPDGWTREIDLTVHICNPSKWNPVKSDLERTLRFLTGDFWYLTFKDGVVSLPNSLLPTQDNCDCVALLSGGVDSLIGAIDLVVDGHKPIYVSQISIGDKENQKNFADKIRAESPLLQWNDNFRKPKGWKSELSTRGRSITFFAFAAIAASAIKKHDDQPVKIFVPENGFISLNIPLNPGRIGSLSTKTTHPVFLKGIQDIWDEVGINAKLIMPYQFKTKGEMLNECKNQNLLRKLVFESISCGRYRSNGFRHCGKCVPCIVRRAAFEKWGKTDETKNGYKYELLERSFNKNPDDVGAMASACLIAKQSGTQQLISGYLSFANHQDRKEFENVFKNGLGEVENFLQGKKIL